ncbi:MAG: M20 family metallopeptidase [Gemmatimonadetes bacterium]|nr:M20 family metallopeptidase [Gemmatimonadota bacterium]
MTDVDADVVVRHVRGLRDPMVELVTRLASVESPSDDPASQAPVQAILGEALESLGFEVRRVGGRRGSPVAPRAASDPAPGVRATDPPGSGGHLYARPGRRTGGLPAQLLLGHSDTVWPHGTLATMPVALEDGRLHGPGTFDMKGGLTQIVFALRALKELGLEPPATPVVFVNSDEEVGSPDSRGLVRLLAGHVCRVFVAEPAYGPEGKLKTERKGMGRFDVHIHGRASHAGLAPEAGVSAIHELAHVIHALHGFTDAESGVTVNVGTVEGGTRSNVVAAHAHATVDVRVVTVADGRRMENAILGLAPRTPGVTLQVTGGVHIPPLERTPRNRRLWRQAQAAAEAMGLELEEVRSGGGSDGNTTSQLTATLDGLGPVGDGAHAVHEHLVVDAWVDRCALLALLLMAPVER